MAAVNGLKCLRMSGKVSQAEIGGIFVQIVRSLMMPYLARK
jgi:hypothetical protein